MPTTRRIRSRWLSPSLKARSQTPSAGLGAFDRGVRFEAESRSRAPPAPPPILDLGCGVRAFRFRFRETPARFHEPRLERARGLPGARDLVQPALEALGEADTVETFDRGQSGLDAEAAQGGLQAGDVGFLRLELSPPRGKPVARRHELVEAAVPVLHPGWWVRTDGKAFPEVAPALLRFGELRRGPVFSGLLQSVSARLVIKPRCLQLVFGQAVRVLDRIVGKTIRFAGETFEVGGLRDERSGGRRLRGSEDGRTQRKPGGFTAAPRLHDALGRRQRAASRKLRKACARVAHLPFRRLPRAHGFPRRAHGALYPRGELSEILIAGDRPPRDRFEFFDRRIEPRRGIRKLTLLFRQRDAAFRGPSRRLGDLAQRRVFLAQRPGIESGPLGLSRMRASSWDFCAWASSRGFRGRGGFHGPTLLDELARFRLSGLCRPRGIRARRRPAGPRIRAWRSSAARNCQPR